MQPTPYDILGVRPGASGSDVEHAYRARRSQYHPDRYSQSDDETQRWATQKMQEVTAAYRAITEGAAFTPEASSTQQPTPPQAGTAIDIESLLRGKASTFVSDKIFLAPNIPPRKVDGVLSSYGYGLQPSDILVIVDNTVFGSAKDGLLVSREGVRFRENALSESGNYLFADLERVQLDKHTLYINGRKQCWLNLPDRHQLAALLKVIDEHVSGVAPASGSTRPAGMPEPVRISSLWARISDSAAKTFTQDMEGDDLQFCRLVSRIDSAIGRHFAQVIAAAERNSRATGRPVDALSIESTSTACMALIAYGFSAVPKSARDAIGKEFFELLALVPVYAETFAASFQAHVGIAPRDSEEERMLLISLFAQDEEQLERQMNLPRGEAILQALEQQGFNRPSAQAIVASASQSFAQWFQVIIRASFNPAS